jgi:PAS domain-containing protein
VKWKSALIESVLLILLTTCLLIFNTRMMKKETERLNSVVMKRLLKPVVALLEDAHRGKDDLQMQRVVAALAGAPGLSSVCVIDRESKILAHSEAARVGECWKKTSRSRASWGASLKEGSQEWGTVIFSMSDRPVQHWIQSDQRRTLVAAAVLLLFLLWRVWIWERKLAHLADRAADQEALIKEARAEQVRVLQQLGCHKAVSGTWLQEALARIPGPHMLLDDCQRIAAVNASALGLLGVSHPDQILGRSWYDLPLALQSINQIDETKSHTWIELNVKNDSIYRSNII